MLCCADLRSLAAARLAKSRGCMVLGICNVVGSKVARETHAGVFLHAGPEIGVASTKAFTSQVTVLMLLATNLGHIRGHLSEAEALRIGACRPHPEERDGGRH